MAQEATFNRLQDLVQELQAATTPSEKFELSAEISRVSRQIDIPAQEEYTERVRDGDSRKFYENKYTERVKDGDSREFYEKKYTPDEEAIVHRAKATPDENDVTLSAPDDD